VPLAVMLVLSAPLGAWSRALLAPAGLGLTLLAVLASVNVVRARPPVSSGPARLRARAAIAGLTMAQPLVRAWGRTRNRAPAARASVSVHPAPRPTGHGPNHVLVYPADRDRADLATELIAQLRSGGLHVVPATGWDDYDARIAAGPFVCGEIVTSEHPAGCIQVRVRRRLHRWAVSFAAIGAAYALTVSGAVFAAVVAIAALAALEGCWRTGPQVERLLRGDRA
jgi:hypothetical protein